MTEINYSELLRQLVDNYFDQQISRVEYVAQRRALLNKIDHEFNGEVATSGWPESDITQPQQQATSSGPPPPAEPDVDFVRRKDSDFFDD